MGKPLIQQRRGKGSTAFTARSFRSGGDIRMPNKVGVAKVVDIVSSTHHSAPLLKVRFEDGEETKMIAPEGVRVGDTIKVGTTELSYGNVVALKDLPEGSTVYNIEIAPGDGGKLVRGSGGVARVVGQQKGKTIVLLPSKKRKTFNSDCRAMLGTPAGGGRLEKPIMKAGIKFHKMKTKNKFWPKVSGAAMNAVAHPFGGKRSSRKGRPTIAPKNAPRGRKVGMIRPRKTGRARGTRVRNN